VKRVAVVGAGVGGLAVAVRLADAGHAVTVFEQAETPGGKCGRVERDGFAWDSGPSLLTLPWLATELVHDLELLPVEPVTRYRFADGSQVELWGDLDRSVEALEAWSPGSGKEWREFMATCERMWVASQGFLRGPPPWPPRRPRPGEGRPSPRDLMHVKPWWTLRDLARAHFRDARMRMLVERFATYAGADPRRAPAALGVAGYVEHAFGAWHPRGGMYALVEGLVERFSGELRLGERVRAVRADGVETDGGYFAADVVISNVDAETTARLQGRAWRRGPRARSLSGLVVMLGLRGRTPGLVHHAITFPPRYDEEFDDVFGARRPVRDPTLYVSASCASDPSEAPANAENWFVLVNAPAIGGGADWDAEASRVVERLGVRDRVVTMAVRSPADLERETGAAAGAIYGVAPHGRLGSLRRPGWRQGGVWLVGGSAHPGGGLPLVLLGARTVARAAGG
jgi:phytoene desaturase